MDTLGEFLTRIRNATMAKHEKVDVPCSNMRIGIAQILKENGYVKDYRVAKDSKQGVMRVYLKYNDKGKSTIEKIQRVSTPGRRLYVKVGEIPVVRSGYGLTILSTNRGIMSGKQAQEQRLGGELLCKLW